MRLCRRCGKEYKGKKDSKVFCSSDCRLKFFSEARKIGVTLFDTLRRNVTHYTKVYELFNELGIEIPEIILKMVKNGHGIKEN